MRTSRGALVLVPNTLDFGAPEPLPALQSVLPLGVIQTAARLSHWVVENAKTTRAFLKRVDAIEPLSRPLQALQIIEIPRPQKGSAKALSAAVDWDGLLAPVLQGHDLGLLSEAGLPAVADPGAGLVQAAHRLGMEVVVLAGPSSILLALAASGLNGQSFAFVGYLPVEAGERSARIRELEDASRRQRQTQLIIETPYRNAALFGALLASLQPATVVSVSCGLTLPAGFSQTRSVAAWRHAPIELPGHLPVVFSLLAA